MPITIETMLAAGYRHFLHNQADAWYRGSYQKRFSDARGTRYFITIVHSVIPAHAGGAAMDSFSATNQLKSDGMTFNVQALYHDESIDKVETFYREMWEKLRLEYYEENETEVA